MYKNKLKINSQFMFFCVHMIDDVSLTTMCNAKFCIALRAFNILIHTLNKRTFTLNTVINTAQQKSTTLYEETGLYRKKKGRMGILIYIYIGRMIDPFSSDFILNLCSLTYDIVIIPKNI
jgi:hypothetical protein